MKLTVIIRNDGPMIHCGDNPSYRTLVIDLTEDQKSKITLEPISFEQGKPKHFEEISKCILEL